MASETTETDSFLVMIEMRIVKLQTLADSYRDAKAAGALGPIGEADGSPTPFTFNAGASSATRSASNAPIDLPTGAFRNMGMAEAIRVYLGAAKRKQPAKQIAEALKAGGLASTAANFDKTLVTTMHRLKNNGVLLQFPEGWDLADAYPEQFRQRLKDAKPAKVTTKKARKKATVKAAKAAARPSEATD